MQRSGYLVGDRVTKRKKEKLQKKLAEKTSANSATVERKGRSKCSCTPLPSSLKLKPTPLVWDFSCKIKRKQQCHLLFALKNC